MSTYNPPELWAAKSSPVSKRNLTKAEEKLAAVENTKGNRVSSNGPLNVCSMSAKSLTMFIHLKIKRNKCNGTTFMFKWAPQLHNTCNVGSGNFVCSHACADSRRSNTVQPRYIGRSLAVCRLRGYSGQWTSWLVTKIAYLADGPALYHVQWQRLAICFILSINLRVIFLNGTVNIK